MTERIRPFAMDFQEVLPEEDTIHVEGEYNNEMQTWDWPTETGSTPMIMSFPKSERPSTTCIRPTQITVDRVRADTVVDD